MSLVQVYRKKEVVSFSWSRFGNSTFRRFSSAIHRTAEIMQQRSYEDAVKALNTLQTKPRDLKQQAEVKDAAKALNTLQTKAQDLEQQAGVKDEVKALNTLQTNAQDLEQIRRSRGRLARDYLAEMRSFTERAGVKMEDLDRLSIIHISGTKGKGSTSAFCESILRHKGFKTGFYSSPHLMEVRERIRINGKPLAKDKFAQYFFDCWDNLHNNVDDQGNTTMPRYFRFLTLVSFHVFLQEMVDVAIVEVGVGGTDDSTNIIRKPVACGVASLGMDHVKRLGGTLESIAWHKAGIFKPGVPAFTVPQPDNAMAVLADRAREIQAPLQVVPLLEHYPEDMPELGLEGEHQYLNASLALQLCTTWLNRSLEKGKTIEVVGKQTTTTNSSSREETADEPSSTKPKLDVPVAKTFKVSDALRNGLKNTRWCGRNQVIVRPSVTFYLDGAHTRRSIEACMKWFKKRADEEKEKESGSVIRVLLFNLTHGRDAKSLLEPLVECNFDHAMFSPNTANVDPKDNDADLTNFTVTRDNQLRCCDENQRVWMALRGAGVQPHADPLQDSSDTDHVIQNAHDDGLYSTTFPCVSQAIRWLLSGKDPHIPPLSPGGFALPDFISKATRLQVLVTGSIHLVGTAMKVLGPEIVGEV